MRERAKQSSFLCIQAFMGSADFFLSPIALLSVIAGLCGGIILLFILSVALFRRTRLLEDRQKMFLKGKNGADLESVILRHDQEIGTLDTEIQELFEFSKKIHSLATIGIHKVGIVRFNPFQDTGSNQSWSIALLDGKNTGIVISSLLSRESARVYAKPVLTGAAGDYPLTNEERRAIEIAQTPRELPAARETQAKPLEKDSGNSPELSI